MRSYLTDEDKYHIPPTFESWNPWIFSKSITIFFQVFVDALTEGEEATQEEKPISAQVDNKQQWDAL